MHHEPVVVTINYVAHSEFLHLPVGVGSSGVVCCFYFFTRGFVYEILAPVEIYQFVGMYTFVVSEIDTAVEIYVLRERSSICRDEPNPVVEVFTLAHSKQRTGRAIGIYLFYLVVCKSTVVVTESVVNQAVRGSVPIAVSVFCCGVWQVVSALSAISVTTSDRGVYYGRQAALLS